MNIGIITHNFPLSLKDRQNAGIFVNDIAQELAIKNRVTVFSPAEEGRGNRVGGVKIVNFPTIKGKKLGDFKFWNPIDAVRFFSLFIGGFLKLSGFIKKNKIDVNVVMWAFPSGVFSYFAKKIYKIPYVTWCLGSDIYVYGKLPLIKYVVRAILRSSDFVFADGIDLAKEVESISGRKCIFIPSASKAKFKRGHIKREKGVISLAFVGRMESIKGPDIFLEALGLIGEDLSKFKAYFIGDGSLLETLKKKVKDMHLDKQIVFYGNIDDFQRISDVTRVTDWLVIPSRSDSIPLVFSEAMKCATPVVTSDLPDLKYLIEKYKVGYLFNKGDFRSLASIMRRLPDSDKERNMFSKNTKLAAINFSIEKSSERLMSYLNKL